MQLCNLIYIISVVEAIGVHSDDSSNMDGIEGSCAVSDDTVAAVKKHSGSCEEGIMGS